MASRTDKTKPLEQPPPYKQNSESSGSSSQISSSQDNLDFVHARVRRGKEKFSYPIDFIYHDGSATSFYTYKSLIHPYDYRPLQVVSIQNDIEYSSLVNQILAGISKEESNCSTTQVSKSKPLRLKVEDVMVTWDIIESGPSNYSSKMQRFNVSLTKLSDEQVRLTLKKMAERGWNDYIQIRFVTVE
jgi:hypothetical protein